MSPHEQRLGARRQTSRADLRTPPQRGGVRLPPLKCGLCGDILPKGAAASVADAPQQGHLGHTTVTAHVGSRDQGFSAMREHCTSRVSSPKPTPQSNRETNIRATQIEGRSAKHLITAPQNRHPQTGKSETVTAQRGPRRGDS